MTSTRTCVSVPAAGVGLLGKLVRCIVALALAGLLVPSIAYAEAADALAGDDAAVEAVQETAQDGGASVAADDDTDTGTDTDTDTDTDEEDTSTAAFSGSGTESDPYLIEDADDWTTLRSYVTAKDTDYNSAYYQLANDLDLTSLSSDAVTVGSNSSSQYFYGTFDGAGHTVTVNIDASSTSYVALFAYTYEATIKNATLAGSITGDSYVAGFVAYGNKTTFESLVNEASITVVNATKSYTGSIVGYAYGSTLSNCANLGSVTAAFTTASTSTTAGYNMVGGLVGYAFLNSSTKDLTLSRCYNAGTVSGNALCLGGLVGQTSTNSSENVLDIESCYNVGTVSYTGENTTSYSYVGGILGRSCMTSVAQYKRICLTNVYNAGTLSSTSSLTVLCGLFGSYYNFTTTYAATYLTGMQNAYWLEGTASCGIKYRTSTADLDSSISGISSVSKTTLTSESFVTEENIGTDFAADTGETLYNSGYPYLRWQNPDSTYSLTFDVSLGDEYNASDENAISLTLVDASDTAVTTTQADGATASAAQWSVSGLSAGDTYTYTVSKKGYDTVTATFAVSAWDETKSIELESSTYSYVLTVSPADASVAFTVDGTQVDPAETSASEDGTTMAYTFDGLYNSNVLAYTVAKYGYTTQSAESLAVSYADAASSVALVAQTAYSATISVSLPSGASSTTAPTLVLYNISDVAALDNIDLFDSRDDGCTPTLGDDGTYTYTVSALYDGTVGYAVYLSGYEMACGELAVSGAAVSASITLVATESVWDGVDCEVGWYTLNKDDSTFTISTAAELAGLSALVGGAALDYTGDELGGVNFAGLTVSLAADIDLGGAQETPSYWTPIGECVLNAKVDIQTDNTFGGTFDGCGHTISNLLVGTPETEDDEEADDESTDDESTDDDDADDADETSTRLHECLTGNALFSSIHGTSSSFAAVTNLTLKDADISADSNALSSSGSVNTSAGSSVLVNASSCANYSDITIEGGSVTNDGVKYTYAGSLMSWGYCVNISGCTSSASVSIEGPSSSTSYTVGGLIGMVAGTTDYSVTVEYCSFTGSVERTGTNTYSGSSYGIGGVLARASGKYITVDHCYNTGSVKGNLSSAGGVIGNASYRIAITNCYNKGTVENTLTTQSTSYGIGVGGIIGRYGTSSDTLTDIMFAHNYNTAYVGLEIEEEDETDESTDGETSSSSSVAAVNSSYLYAGGLVGIAVYGFDDTMAVDNYFANDVSGSASAAIGHTGSVSATDTSTSIEGVAEGATSDTMKTAAFVTDINGDASTYVIDRFTINDGFPVYAEDAPSVADADIEAIASQVYTGEELEPGIEATLLGSELVEGEDYTLSYADNIDVGTATVTVTGINGCSGSVDVYFEITAANIVFQPIDDIDSLVYTGNPLTPSVTVTNVNTGETLVEGVDYTLSYADNTDVGTATVTVTGIGNFTGTTTATFAITAADIADQDAADIDAQAYTGSALEPGIVITNVNTGETLVEGTDYLVFYASNIEVGTAGAYIVGIGNFGGTFVTTFAIEAADIAEQTIEAIDDQVYTGSALEPELAIENATTGAALVLGTDYTVSYADNVEVGTATVTVEGIGGYTGTATATFAIVEPATLSGATVTLSAESYVYDGTAATPAVTVTAADGTVLVEGTDYSVTYADNVEVGTATVTIVGLGDYAGTETSATFEITQASLASARVLLSATAYVYDGSACEPDVYVFCGSAVLVEGTDYSVTYTDNVEAGTATVTVEGIGNYTGSTSTTFTIAAASLSDATVALESDSYEYTAYAIEPAVTVTAADGTVLVEGTDYTVTYTDNVYSGTAYVTITGTGSYSGELTATFAIVISTLFPDVMDESKYYYDSVYELAALGVVGGYTSGSKAGYFGTGDKMTRAQLATILWRALDPEDAAAYDADAYTSTTTSVSGIEDGQYWTAAADWCVENGIIEGKQASDGSRYFAAGDYVTLEQLCQVLANYLDASGRDALTDAYISSVLSDYEDGDDVNSWAQASMVWAIDAGLVQGTDAGYLNSDTNMGRERVVTVIARAIDNGLLVL